MRFTKAMGGTRAPFEWSDIRCGFALFGSTSIDRQKDWVIGNIYENLELLSDSQKAR